MPAQEILVLRLGSIELDNIPAGNACLLRRTGKIADRYGLPVSGPWRLRVVGSWATAKYI